MCLCASEGSPRVDGALADMVHHFQLFAVGGLLENGPPFPPQLHVYVMAVCIVHFPAILCRKT